jgi:hypothetical protein
VGAGTTATAVTAGCSRDGPVTATDSPRDATATEEQTPPATNQGSPTVLWRAYRDSSSGEIVVVGGSGEVARNSNASTALQNALDAAYQKFEESNYVKYRTETVIDCGSLIFTLDSGIRVKRGTKLLRANFEAAGVTDEPAITFGGPDNTYTHAGIAGEDITVHEAGDVGIRFRDVAGGKFSDIKVLEPQSHGIHVQSSLLNEFESVYAQKGEGHGFYFTEDGDSEVNCNANAFLNCRAMNVKQDGYHLLAGRGQTFVDITSETNGGRGFVIDGGYRTISTAILNPWFESNQREGILERGEQTLVFGGRYTTNDQESSGPNHAIRLAGKEPAVYGPVSFRPDGQSFSHEAATDPTLWNMDSTHQVGGEGTRATYDGVGYNEGDPSTTGEWHEAGVEGSTVVDIVNDELYTYRRGRWV